MSISVEKAFNITKDYHDFYLKVDILIFYYWLYY